MIYKFCFISKLNYGYRNPKNSKSKRKKSFWKKKIPFFKDEKLFYTLKESGGNFEAIEIVISFSSDKKDFFLNVSKLDCN